MSMIEDIHTSFTSDDYIIQLIKYSVVSGFGVYFVLLLYLRRTCQSLWDLSALRKVLLLLRLVIVTEIGSLIVLLYFVSTYGNPLRINYSWQVVKGFSWLYSYPRPITGIILIGFGFIGEMHVFIRFMSICGCLFQIASDTISAMEVNNFYNECESTWASPDPYSISSLYIYFIRDIISIGLCTSLCCLLTHIIILLRLSVKQEYSYSEIIGGDMNRYEVMKHQRSTRNIYL